MNTFWSRIRFVFSITVYPDESRYTVSVRSTVPSYACGRCPLVGLSGLEPPTSRLSGARSNLLSYKPMWCDSMYLQPAVCYNCWWRWWDSNPWPPACRAGALPTELHPLRCLWVFPFGSLKIEQQQICTQQQVPLATSKSYLFRFRLSTYDTASCVFRSMLLSP